MQNDLVSNAIAICCLYANSSHTSLYENYMHSDTFIKKKALDSQQTYVDIVYNVVLCCM